MKKIVIIFCLALLGAIIMSCTVPNTSFSFTDKSSYIRIRIIANSDSPYDQNVKLALRNKLVEYLTPVLSVASSKQCAVEIIENKKHEINAFCNDLLASVPYGCSVSLRKELFPLRTYDGEAYPEGEYDALVITLGDGEGQNWWCVAYPPLCFINGTPNPDSPNNITYRSFIMEWLAELF